MKKPFLKVALIPAVLLLAFASGCNVIEAPGGANLDDDASLVLHEQFCVQFDENRQSGTFESEIVCDQFQDEILQWLADNNVNLSDICSIFMSGGEICLKPYQGHDWDITSKVKIKRLDIWDGPQTLLHSQTVTIPDSFDPCYRPSFGYRGVRLVNRALNDLVQGGNPVLQVSMIYTDVDPEPSPSDPLIFSWCACIDIVAVVGGGGDDDDSAGCGDDGSS